MARSDQLMLFETEDAAASAPNSTTFIDNMKLPVHRWFRYSAGFSAQWAESLIAEQRKLNRDTRVLDPFAGSGTTLLASQDVGIVSYGVESHPFVARIARAKLARHSDPKEYRSFARKVLKIARLRSGGCQGHAPLIMKCYTPEALAALDSIRAAYEHCRDTSAASELTWLTLLGILRKTSHVGTANWQYVLPKKSKKGAVPPFDAFEEQIEIVHRDMLACQDRPAVTANLIEGDARGCDGVPAGFANLVITSPPYPNNYDYADATRLEMTFMREIEGWGDLHESVRKHLVVSCSQHVPERAVDFDEVIKTPEIAPIRPELSEICESLGKVRLSKGGKKTYHLMVACYFRDLARAWIALRRVCGTPCKVCFVLGDSAPYGVYVPVMDWMGRLAVAAGFADSRFGSSAEFVGEIRVG